MVEVPLRWAAGELSKLESAPTERLVEDVMWAISLKDKRVAPRARAEALLVLRDFGDEAIERKHRRLLNLLTLAIGSKLQNADRHFANDRSGFRPFATPRR